VKTTDLSMVKYDRLLQSCLNPNSGSSVSILSAPPTSQNPNNNQWIEPSHRPAFCIFFNKPLPELLIPLKTRL